MEGNIMESTLTMNTDRPTDKLNTKAMENISNEEHTQTQTLAIDTTKNVTPSTYTNTLYKDLTEKDKWNMIWEMVRKLDDGMKGMIQQQEKWNQKLKEEREQMTQGTHNHMEQIGELCQKKLDDEQDKTTNILEDKQELRQGAQNTCDKIDQKLNGRKETEDTVHEQGRNTSEGTIHLTHLATQKMESTHNGDTPTHSELTTTQIHEQQEDTLEEINNDGLTHTEHVYTPVEDTTHTEPTPTLKKQEDTHGETTNKEHKMTGSTHIHGQGHIDTTENDTESRPIEKLIAYEVNEDTGGKGLKTQYTKDCAKAKKCRTTTKRHYTQWLEKLKHRWRRKEA